MKKSVLATIIMSMGISLIGCSNQNAQKNEVVSNGSNVQQQHQQQQQATLSKNEISVEQAKEIALKHANLTSDKVTFLRSELDFDNGIKKYEIEFYHENKEYDYEISATDGKIIGYDYDAEYYNAQPQINNSGVKVTAEQAKEIALKLANLKSNQVVFGRVDMDYDDGIQKYDVEFYYNNMEYNYEIDANTGNIVSYELD